MLRYAGQIDWRYVNPQEALRLRGDDAGLYFSDILTAQMQKLNPGVVDARRPEENRERNVQLIDFHHPDNNIFHVTDEWSHPGAAFTNRADAVFLITTEESLERFEGLAEDLLNRLSLGLCSP
ncbi:MAG: hypothetical protein A4E49_02819 [Methanosaeta sp. PtaU1.Bin112]|nr:MAG: hypothetical protein A4E49_02819 [Methanosaeta sp. PtaU1.Bin112]